MSFASPRFTVVMRIGRSVELLPHSVASVLAQTEQSFELLLVCDGETPVFPDAALALASRDSRLRLMEPRGNQPGEGDWRATALAQAGGALVAEMSDEALWFPDHLGELAALLSEVDFGNLLHVELDPGGSVHFQPADLGDPATRHRMLSSGWSAFDASCAGYHLNAYRRLPDTARSPTDPTTDLTLWRRFLSSPGIAVGTRFAVEGVTLAAAYRQALPDAGALEGATVSRLISNHGGRNDLRHRALASWHADLAAAQAAVDSVASDLQELYQARSELSTQVAEYAHSRAEYAHSRAEYALDNAELRARIGRLTSRNRRLSQRLKSIEGSTSWRLMRRLAGLRAAVARRARRP